MKKFQQLWRSKKLRYGGMASFLTLILIVILIAVNVLLNTLANRYSWKLDVTEGQIYTLSDTTRDILKSLDKDVHILGLYPEGQEDPTIMEILRRYERESDHITVETADPAKNPTMGMDTSTQLNLSYGVVLFDCDGKTKTVSLRELLDVNSETGETDRLIAEQQYTSAILFVTSDYTVNLAFTTGHNEGGSGGAALTVAESFYESLNANVSEINLLTEDIPSDTNMLCIVSPLLDFTDEEIQKLDRFLANGGNVQYFPTILGEDLPRLDAYLSEWGLRIYNDYVVDQGPNNNANQAVYLLPNIKNHDITASFNGQGSRVLFPYSRSISVENILPSVETTTIMETSDVSFARRDVESESTDKIDTDVDGPHTVMLLAERSYDNGNVGKLLLYGTSTIMEQSILQDKGYGVTGLLSGAYTYLTGESSPIVDVAGRTLRAQKLLITVTQLNVILIILAVLALAILLAGIVVWAKRRHL